MASRAIQSMVRTAWSESLGSTGVSLGGLDALKPLLGVLARLEVLAVLPIGYPGDKPTGQGKKQRKALSEVAHREQWGQPFIWPHGRSQSTAEPRLASDWYRYHLLTMEVIP